MNPDCIIECVPNFSEGNDAGVVRQSNALSFTDAYLLLGTIFLAGLPLLLLSSRKRGKKPVVALADH